MTLIHSPASPFVRKVRVLLIETGQDDVALQEVSTSPMATDPGLMAAAPLAKIPTLIRDDGPAMFDSRVICRFLDDRAGAGLYPESRLWEVLTLEALSDGMCEAAVGMVYERRFRPEEKQMPEWLDAQWAKVARALDAVDGPWLSHLAGPLTMAQVAIGCALCYLDLRHSDRNWRDGRPELASWYASFSERPSMTATEPPTS
ncbi:glutathione S-transferase [Rhodobacterales bacterium HKCCE3408]|nr:glutathione S-transferase [Rhodobacterales bacterium HKCCE3408]